MSFDDVRFPTAISRGSSGGPERRTEIVVTGSGAEERNSRWADSRRRYDAGFGVRSLDDIHQVIAFFEERRGRLMGFRWKDHLDWKSCAPGAQPSAFDQAIGTGTGTRASFQLAKRYGTQREDVACQRATAHDSPFYATVKTMLATGADLEPIASVETPGSYQRTRFTRSAADLFSTAPATTTIQ